MPLKADRHPDSTAPNCCSGSPSAHAGTLDARAVDAAAREAFLAAMRCTASGVSVVTTDGAAGRLGVTVSSVSSVSADPPLLLACVNRRSPVLRAILGNRVFAVNILATRHRTLAESFSGHSRSGRAFDFDRARWNTASTGAPMLRGAPAAFDCVLEAAPEAGTHTIFIGRVMAVSTGTGVPLLYSDRRYGRLLPLNGQYRTCT